MQYQVPQASVIPTCPCNCMDSEVVFVKYVKSSNSVGYSMYFCKECRYLFDYAPQIDSALQCMGIYEDKSSTLSMSTYTSSGRSLSDEIRSQAIQAVRDTWGYNLDMAHKPIEGDSSFNELRGRVWDLEDREKARAADPLYELRRRVAEFKL